MITRENVKYYVQLISKKLRIEETFDYVPTYYYDYKINLYETDEVCTFCIEIDTINVIFCFYSKLFIMDVISLLLQNFRDLFHQIATIKIVTGIYKIRR